MPSAYGGDNFVRVGGPDEGFWLHIVLFQDVRTVAKCSRRRRGPAALGPPKRHVYITLFGAAAAELEKYVSDKKMAPIKGPYLECTLHLFVHLFHLFHRVMVMMMVMMMHRLCHRLRIFCACD